MLKGNLLSFSTDHIFTNFDTELRVYEGDCNTNTCIAQNDDVVQSNTKSTVIFNAELDKKYIIYLDGFNAAARNFGLSIICFEGDQVTPCGDPVFATTSAESNRFGFDDYDNNACNPTSLFDGNDKSFLYRAVHCQKTNLAILLRQILVVLWCG